MWNTNWSNKTRPVWPWQEFKRPRRRAECGWSTAHGIPWTNQIILSLTSSWSFLLDSIKSVPRWPTPQTLPDRCSRASSSSMPVWTTKQWHEALFCLHFHAQQFKWPIQFRSLRYSTCVEDDMFFVERHTYLYNKWPTRIGEDVVNRSLHFPFGDVGNKIKWQQQKCVIPKMPVVDVCFQSWAHQAQIG